MNRKGFTLVEILAVIAIIGILSLLIVPNVIESYREAHKHAMITQEHEMIDAAELFIEDYCRNPLSQNEGQCPVYSLGTSNDKKYTCLNIIQMTKYIDPIVANGQNCAGFVVYNSDYSNYKAYLQCGSSYATEEIKNITSQSGDKVIDLCGGNSVIIE